MPGRWTSASSSCGMPGEHTMDEGERCMLAERIRVLSTMLREARELAVLCERYYDRGYRRNVKYTI